MTTRRKFLIVVLAGFLLYTGIYVFVYLARAFTLDPADVEYTLVNISHTDNFSRTILIAVFFVIGEVFAIYLALARGRRGKDVTVRKDLWEWLEAREELTGEPAEAVAHRAIAHYRARLEGGDAGLPSS
jgi:hypothetical protein